MKTFLSFDVGEKNFAYCVGEIIEEKIIEENENLFIKKIGHHNVLKKKTQTVVESCVFLTEILENEILNELNEILNYQEIIILIEQQMRTNIRAQKLAQHLWSYFYVKFPPKTHPNICLKFVPSHLKTQYFLGKNNLDNRMRKKWAVSKVNQILNESTHDQHKIILTQINDLHKKDDVCDTILQMFAFFKIND